MFHSTRRRIVRLRSGLVVLTLALGGVVSTSCFGQTNCSMSQATYAADQQLLTQRPPTHLRLMGSRYVDLIRAERGLNCSQVPLVAFDGLHYRRGGGGDDPGLFYVVPEVGRLLHLSLPTAIDVTLIAIVVGATIVGLLGFVRTVQTAIGRRVGIIVFLLLAILQLIAGDVYILNAAPAIAGVPWVIYFASRMRITAAVLITFVLLGFVAQAASFLRAYAGVGLFLFTFVVVLGLYKMSLSRKALVLGLFLLGATSTQMFINGLYLQRSAFLGAQQDSLFEAKQIHPFWHSVYIGLGYVKNSEVPAYRDEVAFAKVESVRPNTPYLSTEYEQVLKQETWELAKRRPWIIVENVLVKVIIIMCFFVAAANVGLYAAILGRKPFWLEIGFALAVAFNSLFGILVVPSPRYLLGLIAFAALYGIYSLEYALQQPRFRDRVKWIEKLVGVDSVTPPGVQVGA